MKKHILKHIIQLGFLLKKGNKMNTALDRFRQYLESINDEQIKQDLIELGIEEWEDEVKE